SRRTPARSWAPGARGMVLHAPRPTSTPHTNWWPDRSMTCASTSASGAASATGSSRVGCISTSFLDKSKNARKLSRLKPRAGGARGSADPLAGLGVPAGRVALGGRELVEPDVRAVRVVAAHPADQQLQERRPLTARERLRQRDRAVPPARLLAEHV